MQDSNIKKPARPRLSVDLNAYPDVLRMLERAEGENPGVNRTWFVIDALRKDLVSKGFARKKDIAA